MFKSQFVFSDLISVRLWMENISSLRKELLVGHLTRDQNPHSESFASHLQTINKFHTNHMAVEPFFTELTRYYWTARLEPELSPI